MRVLSNRIVAVFQGCVVDVDGTWSRIIPATLLDVLGIREMKDRLELFPRVAVVYFYSGWLLQCSWSSSLPFRCFSPALHELGLHRAGDEREKVL